MTARTHDLAAFTALNFVFISSPFFTTNFASLVVAVAANFIGGLAPDLDNSSTHLWKQFRGGSVIAKILSPLLGGHRLISHSLLGVFLAGVVARFALNLIATILIVDLSPVWWTFMIGYGSHLLADLVTRDGLPLLFPLPWKFGFPPLKRLRIKTGSMVEKGIIFPGLMLLNGYWFYIHSQKYLDFLQMLISRS